MVRSHPIRHGRVLAAGAAALMVLSACTKTLDISKLEGAIKERLEELAPGTKAEVNCPDSRKVAKGDTFECTATADDGSSATVTVTQTSDDGDVKWEVTS